MKQKELAEVLGWRLRIKWLYDERKGVEFLYFLSCLVRVCATYCSEIQYLF